MVQLLKEVQCYGHTLRLVKCSTTGWVYIVLTDVCRMLNLNVSSQIRLLKQLDEFKNEVKSDVIPGYYQENGRESILNVRSLDRFFSMVRPDSRGVVIKQKLYNQVREMMSDIHEDNDRRNYQEHVYAMY